MTVTATPSTPSTPDAERADLLAELDVARAALRAAIAGLTDAQLGERPTASALCLGGLVKHVANTEEVWGRFLVVGPSAMTFPLPDGVTWDDIVGGTAREYPAWILARQEEFAMGGDDTAASVLARYARVAARTEEVVVGLPDLSVTQEVPAAPWGTPAVRWSARRVLIHLVAETVQHAGHADILRESIDGRTAM